LPIFGNIEEITKEKGQKTSQKTEKKEKAAAQTGQHGSRDDALVLLMFRHGLYVSELIALLGNRPT
jgi:hypothetical protein